MGADERQLRTDLPKPAVGFQPPLPLIVNIQIARATGEITTSRPHLHPTHRQIHPLTFAW
jgi:hypothetical protein